MCKMMHRTMQKTMYKIKRSKGLGVSAPFFSLCHSKNKPPALQVEGISSDKSNSCAKIDVGLQTTNKKAQEVQKWTITV